MVTKRELNWNTVGFTIFMLLDLVLIYSLLQKFNAHWSTYMGLLVSGVVLLLSQKESFWKTELH